MDMRFERRLLQLIRENEIIYNSKHPKFKINKSRMDAWDAIAKELHSDVETCRRRWRGLRNTYRKIKTKNATLGLSDGETLSKWCYLDDFADLPFVDRHEAPVGNESGCNNLYSSQQQQSVEKLRTEAQQKETFMLSKERVQAVSENRKRTLEHEDNLVQEIRKYKLLWDKTHPDYKNNYQKSFVWKIIAKSLQTSPKMCQSMWLSMQSRYRIKRMKAYEEGGQIFYHSPYKYRGKMAFINEFQKSSRLSECSASDVEEVNDSHFWKDDSPQIEKTTNSLPVISVETLRTKNQSGESNVSRKLLNTAETNTNKRIRHQSQSEDEQNRHKRPKLIHSNISNCSPKTAVVNSSCSHYLYTLGTKLDNLKIPLRVKYDLERRVGNLVYEVLAQFSVDEN